MKKFLALLAALIMIFTLAGCGEYVTPVQPATPVTPVKPDDPVNPDDPGDPEKEQPFTVTLMYMGQPFRGSRNITALWNDLETGAVYTAPFDDGGYAQMEGLDGDYRVTLSAPPQGYTYDPNYVGHIATNDAKDVAITLLLLTPTNGSGASFSDNDRITLTSFGTYRVTLNSPRHEVHFYYYPKLSGDYVITSLIDVTANVVNPILDVYTVNSGGFYLFRETCDGGGYENTFTKNFEWRIGLSKNEIGNPFGFVLRTESLNDDAFPINIDFRLSDGGDFTGELPIVYVPVPVTEQFISLPNSPAGAQFNYVSRLNRVQGGYELDASPFKLYSKAEGGDGYYHFYDETTGTYGATLYAKVSQGTEIMDAFTNELVSKRCVGRDYNELVAQYAAHCNSDGVYPVTEELKQFINDYCDAQYLFNDGNGRAEEFGYNATRANQWLFACGFYTSGRSYENGGAITDIRG